MPVEKLSPGAALLETKVTVLQSSSILGSLQVAMALPALSGIVISTSLGGVQVGEVLSTKYV